MIYVYASSNGHVPDQRALLTGFVAAGFATWSILRIIYWRSHATGVPRLWRPGSSVHALFWGTAVGCVAGAAAVLYLTVMLRWSIFTDLMQMSLDTSRVTGWLVALAVLAAPLFEEFLFRGVIFTGLQRMLPTWQAAAVSAWVFAMAHPPLSAAPVWLLGFGCALAYARTGSLLAPIVAHGLYNGMVLALQWQG